MSLAVIQILAVDDNQSDRHATTRVLETAGYEVRQARTGTAGVLAADAALVIIDGDLADMNGVEVCRRLRAQPETAYIPVLHIAAGSTQAVDFSPGLETGPDGCLTRPVEPAVLLAMVRTLLFARRADIMRREADAKLSAMLELAPIAIATLDAASHYEDVNPAFCRLWGFTAGELRGRSAIEMLALPAADVNEGQGQADLARKDGRRLHVEWQLATDAMSQCRILVLTELTDRERVAAERDRVLERERSARADAERNSRLKDEFLATLSHELRNPLNAILGWSTLLGRTPDLPPAALRAVQAIERNSRVQAQMIADLLDYAGITFGKMRLVTSTIDPYPVLRAALDVVQAAATAGAVTIHSTFGSGDILIEADVGRLQQVFWNLLSNAIKFSRPGGNIEVGADRRGETFEVVVRDHGAGIDRDFLPRIFDRFSQQDSSSTRTHGGLGLGLAIARQLVTQHGGAISACSDGPGLGATFTVSLPLSENEASLSLSDSQVLRTLDLRGVIALVVEDDIDARDLTKRILMDAGADVVEVASADAAMSCIQGSRANFLISDIGMAGKDGYQLMRALRAAGYAPDTLPAIALTAFARMQDRNESIAAGFQDHLVKPVDAQLLISRVGSLRRAAANANAKRA